jgi:Mycotoxin biosynthesis protein UstYa
MNARWLMNLDRAGVIAAEDGPPSGLTKAHVQRSKEFGGGYFVNVEGMHHLHCLVGSSDVIWATTPNAGVDRTWFAKRYTLTFNIIKIWEPMPSRTRSRFSVFMFVSCLPCSSVIEPPLTRVPAHCLDTVRQVLMCNADTGVLGQVWYDPASPKAFPDFHTRHKCKNYDEIRKWAEALQVCGWAKHDCVGDQELTFAGSST